MTYICIFVLCLWLLQPLLDRSVVKTTGFRLWEQPSGPGPLRSRDSGYCTDHSTLIFTSSSRLVKLNNSCLTFSQPLLAASTRRCCPLDLPHFLCDGQREMSSAGWFRGRSFELINTRSVFVNVNPTPTSLSERRAVLHALQRHGTVEVFKRLPVSDCFCYY